jgi:hypothetical protein
VSTVDTPKSMTRVDGERYKKALTDIKAHMEKVTGVHCYMATAWVIAKNALNNEKDNDK